jgi:hypothetical protein
MPAPNLLGRCRPTGEQISSMKYLHSLQKQLAGKPLHERRGEGQLSVETFSKQRLQKSMADSRLQMSYCLK